MIKNTNKMMIKKIIMEGHCHVLPSFFNFSLKFRKQMNIFTDFIEIINFI